MEIRVKPVKLQHALLLAAHNEELLLGDTLASAIAAGMDPRDIFVVSDGSTDRTFEVALRYLPARNILNQAKAGKSRAIFNGLRRFHIATRYEWIHLADADSVFAADYFHVFAAKLSDKYVAGTGYIECQRAGFISKYRTFEYTIGLEIGRRIQNWFGAISVLPGATCVYRTDILDRLEFVGSMTEDMDLTIQIHRKKLGRILYEPAARVTTQEPKNLHDYVNQISRWYRGVWQVLTRHRVGTKLQTVDGYIAYTVLQQVAMIAEIAFMVFWAWWSQNWGPVAILFLYDFVVFFGFALWAAKASGRGDIISVFPFFYLLRFVNLFVFFRSWFEIVVQKKFQSGFTGWTTDGRRYRIGTDAHTIITS